MSIINKQIEDSRKKADFIGSLVITPHSDRPTESTQSISFVGPTPSWWNNFWLTYQGVFSQFTEEQAKKKII